MACKIEDPSLYVSHLNMSLPNQPFILIDKKHTGRFHTVKLDSSFPVEKRKSSQRAEGPRPHTLLTLNSSVENTGKTVVV